jgi:hypothetical protein
MSTRKLRVLLATPTAEMLTQTSRLINQNALIAPLHRQCMQLT